MVRLTWPPRLADTLRGCNDGRKDVSHRLQAFIEMVGSPELTFLDIWYTML